VVGNSAGAGLGLAAAQWLQDAGYRKSNGLVHQENLGVDVTLADSGSS
jgi:acetyl esterase/lipase